MNNNQAGKGCSPPRNNYSADFRSNYESINWNVEKQTGKAQDRADNFYCACRETGNEAECACEACNNLPDSTQYI